MRTILLTGFPGSGKTTVLLSLVSYLKDKMDPRAVLIIETENGDVHMDARLFNESPFCIKDLTRGCIGCTSMAGSLYYIIDEIRSNSFPTTILVETSCLSHKSLLTIFDDSFPSEDPPLLILVLNPQTWDTTFVESEILATSMVELSNIILINNKEENLSSLDSLGMDSLVDGLKEINKDSNIWFTSDYKKNMSEIWEQIGVTQYLVFPSQLEQKDNSLKTSGYSGVY
jgi:G3E family GTPase